MGSTSFEYFQGPVEEMSHLAKGDQACSFCGQTGRCFYLGEETHGCFACLRQGRFTFSHNTEVGCLSPQGVRRLYRDQQKVPDSFNRAALAALLRTPQFTTWQEPRWLAHCDDFMCYLGEWKPQDFRRQADDGDGRRLFFAMTSEDSARLWDDATPRGADGPEDWYATCYAFRCRHCGRLRGYWDCP